jgi:hypothetical protein
MDTNRTSNTYTSADSIGNMNIYLEHSKIVISYGFYSTMSFILLCMAGTCSIIGCFFLELSLLLNSYRDEEKYINSVCFIKRINAEIYNIYSNKFKNSTDSFLQEPVKNVETLLTPMLNKISNYIASIHDEEVEENSTINIKLEPTYENENRDGDSDSDSSSISHISLGEYELNNMSSDESSSETSETFDDIIDVTDEMISKIQIQAPFHDLTNMDDDDDDEIEDDDDDVVEDEIIESSHSDETNETNETSDSTDSTDSDQRYETEESNETEHSNDTNTTNE